MPGSICGRSYSMGDAKGANFCCRSEGPDKWTLQDVSQMSELGSVSYRRTCAVSIAVNKFWIDEQSMVSWGPYLLSGHLKEVLSFPRTEGWILYVVLYGLCIFKIKLNTRDTCYQVTSIKLERTTLFFPNKKKTPTNQSKSTTTQNKQTSNPNKQTETKPTTRLCFTVSALKKLCTLLIWNCEWI